MPQHNFPRFQTLDKAWKSFFGDKQMESFTNHITQGATYTVVYTVSSSCDSEIQIGFGGSGGFFIVNGPPRANEVELVVTDIWKAIPTRIETRQECKGKYIGINKMTIVAGDVNCLRNNNI